MAYSRWSCSVWYTYWVAETGDENPYESVLQIDRNTLEYCHYTYEDLLTIERTELENKFSDASEEEIDELLEIIERFKSDVEEEYGLKG